MNPNPNGKVTIEGDYVTITWQRQLPHPREEVWYTITDPKELFEWFNTRAVIEGRNGGTIDFVNTISHFHTTGRILVWDPPRVFEHEWHITPNPSLPNGEPEAVIRWELVQDGDSNTRLIVTLSRLTKSTSVRFAPGTHAYLDRLEAHLNGEVVTPEWTKRFIVVKDSYPSALDQGLVLGSDGEEGPYTAVYCNFIFFMFYLLSFILQ